MKKNILTIEDCRAVNFVIKSVLKKDYDVTAVNNCMDAVQQMQADHQDLIILNIPDASSENMELLEHIHSSSLLKNIPTVVISNSDDESLKNKSVELGASLFLTKPFDPVFLSNRVKELVRDKTEAHKKKKSIFNLNIF